MQKDLLALHADKRISFPAILLCNAAGQKFESVEDASFLGDGLAEYFIVLVRDGPDSNKMLRFAVTQAGFALLSWDGETCLGTLSHDDVAELRETVRPSG